MNKIRRKTLQEIIEAIESVKADLATVLEEESEARDNIPESMQGSERYEAADAACDNLDSAVNSLDEALMYIEEAMA